MLRQMWRHRSWDVPQSPSGDVDIRYPPSWALPPSSYCWVVKVLWRALGERLPVLAQRLARNLLLFS